MIPTTVIRDEEVAVDIQVCEIPVVAAPVPSQGHLEMDDDSVDLDDNVVDLDERKVDESDAIDQSRIMENLKMLGLT